MASLIPEDQWLDDVIHGAELEGWDPTRSECCTIQNFKLHLRGTPADPWNTSATRVFTDHFLETHVDTYPDVWAVRYMVLKKTRAHIKSLIKKYTLKNSPRSVREARKMAQNRRERKVTVRFSLFRHTQQIHLFPTCCSLSFIVGAMI
jgi:hypothetical protein